LLNNENSTLVELNSFEEAMIEIINNYEKANKKAQNLFDKIKKEYSIEQIVRKHEKIYLEASSK
jgi:glycosyltransferase involved in cell wall biosynthesis